MRCRSLNKKKFPAHVSVLCDIHCHQETIPCNITTGRMGSLHSLYATTHCNTLQHTATHCNILQHTTTRCNVPLEGWVAGLAYCNILHYIAMYHSPPHRNTLKHTVTYGSTLQHTTTHCNTLQHLQHTASYCNTLQHTASHRNTLQHTATHCNTL